jgi:hypothetical protein
MSASTEHAFEDHRDVQRNIGTHIVTFLLQGIWHCALNGWSFSSREVYGALITRSDDKATERLSRAHISPFKN